MIKGYLSANEIVLLANEARKVPKDGIIVEIGSYLGKSTVTMAESADESVTIFAVDAWDNRAMGKEPKRDTYPEFRKNTEKYKNIIPMRNSSLSIAKSWYKPINLLFIDGDHSEEAVRYDLMSWVPHVVSKGILLLHDYTRKCGVKPAFLQFTSGYKWVESKTITGSILRAVVC